MSPSPQSKIIISKLLKAAEVIKIGMERVLFKQNDTANIYTVLDLEGGGEIKKMLCSRLDSFEKWREIMSAM